MGNSEYSFCRILIVAVVVLVEIHGVFSQNESSIRFVSMEKPEDILQLEEVTIVQLKKAWNFTHDTYALATTNPGGKGRIKIYWYNLKSSLLVINDWLREFDRRIVESQPSILLNELLSMQHLDTLRELSDTPTDDPVTHWKVKWVEVSSLATQIHWLFNKRIRDIMENVPYIKTIANSLAKYYGNPWYPKISGRTSETHRYPMRNYPRWIDDRLFSSPSGNLFYGLRKLLDECRTCKSGSAVARDTCMKDETFGKVVPVRLDAPIYVLFYLCLVDVKFYILKNFFHMYREVYENNPYANYSVFDDRLQSRLRRKIDSYSASFTGYDAQEKLGKKVMPGFFRCDPPPIQKAAPERSHAYGQTYIKLTNVAAHFIVPEKDLTPSGNCSSTCQEIAKADSTPCYKSEEECRVEAYPECVQNPGLCNNFKPLCPLQDTFCFKSGMSATVCPSKAPSKLFEWVKFDNSPTETFPTGASTCADQTRTYSGTTETDPVTNTPQNCEICVCQCIEPLKIGGSEESIRFFSQKESLALIQENRVAVGFKFQLVGNQFSIMIADAVSLPGYKVDMSTVVWRKPTPADPNKPEEIVRVSRYLRPFHLDSFRAPRSYVITGIRFANKSHGLPGSPKYQPFIGVKLRVTKVDSKTGLLNTSDVQWLMNPNTEMKAPYKYVAPASPILADGPALPDSGANQFIFFRTTHLSKSADNEVIPFLDNQEIIMPERNNALKGVGIFHKRRVGYGGMLGIKILPFGERE